ncbi:hypothetical protein K8S19_08930 [bacterium]|nr:hypothetical protein [bacterium]
MNFWVAQGKRLLVLMSLVSLLAGCGLQKQTVWTQDHLATFYTTPRQAQVGEIQAAIRIQDRDYRILEIAAAELELRERGQDKGKSIILKSGPGRDWRGWIVIPKPGKYEVLVTFAAKSQEKIPARFFIEVPSKR